MNKLRLLILSLVLLSFAGKTFSKDNYHQTIKFNRFLESLSNYYVDSVDIDEVVEKAITDILYDLDPHSTYISADDLKKMNEPLEGNFEGIGISFNILKDTLFVISPISGGPSEKVGIIAGDRIIQVDGENIAGTGLTNEDVFSLLKGKKGTKVEVSILRKGSGELIDFLIIRDKIPIFSIDASYMVDELTGYIKINRFSATTVNEFQEAAELLRKNGAKNLILDLNNNGGGYLDAAVKLADEFLDNAGLIVYTEGLNSPRQEFLATNSGSFQESKVIVLIDEGSASASEIVTGAIQDHDRGIVIGRRSFGKGLVQRQLLLPDYSAIRLTIAKYYTPSGRLIQKPYANGTDDYHAEIYERYSHGEHFSKDSIQFPDSLKYKTLNRKRTVYGGGGIMPDIFVPFDTSYYSDYYRDALRKGLLNQFVLSYVDDNREDLQKKYKTFESFYTNFQITEEVMAQFFAYAEKDGLEKNEEDIQVSYDQMKTLIKAFVARDLWNTSEFYQVLNVTNANYNKALEVIKDWDKYASEILQ